MHGRQLPVEAAKIGETAPPFHPYCRCEIMTVVGKSANGARNLKPQNLMDELANSGVKFNANNVVMITKTPDGKLVWLERGNSSAGLQHIEVHASQFAAKGISVEQIPELIASAVTDGEIMGWQGTRPIYEVVFNGQIQRVAVTIGENGFIVGANPVSLP